MTQEQKTRFEDFEENTEKVNLRISKKLRKELKQFALDIDKPMQEVAAYFLKMGLYTAKHNPNQSITFDVDNL